MTDRVRTTPRPAGCVRDLARCLDCHARLDGREVCAGCGRAYPESGGALQAIGPLTGTNRIAASFYDGPGWARFKPLEQLFLFIQGPGQLAARRRILRHLPDALSARVLEVGIGDGDNLPLLPLSWEVYGVDVARKRLERCRERHPRTEGRLAWAEAEALPFEDETFDAVFTVGGINYFRDPAAALGEMSRVVRPGGTLIAADERADLHQLSFGHMLGLEALDLWCLRLSGLDPEFLSMVLSTPPRVESAARLVWPDHKRLHIWNRLGYCLVDVRED
jgi:SAM-dependent methyltransferase